jgi:tRNA1(Val) A37 N6-methylase TrmN6
MIILTQGTDLSSDTFFNGRIRINQSRSGYRYAIDAVLLTSYARIKTGNTIIDLGTGCGIIPIMLAYRYPEVKIYGIEIQKELADLALRNVEENRMTDQIRILCGDMKHPIPEAVLKPVDLVISNPPYRKAGSGRVNPNRQRATARHEICVTLFEVVETARRLLKKSGRFVMIYPAERTADVLNGMRKASIEPKSLQTIHSYADTDAKLILFEGIKGGRAGMRISSPLIIYREDGRYTDAVEKMFAP